jgi:hypothetical protein
MLAPSAASGCSAFDRNPLRIAVPADRPSPDELKQPIATRRPA